MEICILWILNQIVLNIKIPFSLPYIDDSVINEVNSVLHETGWLTSGPKVLDFEKEIIKNTKSKAVVCVNSWTSGAMLVLRWFNIVPGDEVIIPSYTYSATALCVLNMGATPVMVDVGDDFNIDPDKLELAITNKTKAIIPVDIAGFPCDYDKINSIVNSNRIRNKFSPNGDNQKNLGRILVISDAAHSIGAIYKSKLAGSLCDITILSFHSVKNITTGEGGAICINLPDNFDTEKEYSSMKILSLNGQSKSAFQKIQPGDWKYDIIEQGLKVNMPDICAAIGLAQIKIYKNKLLPERKKIFQIYNKYFDKLDWAIIPKAKDNDTESSYHLYLLRIKDISEVQRDKMIHIISKNGISVNVHYIPMPSLTLFKKMGYNIKDYPNTHSLYKNEITLPVYNNLSLKNLRLICSAVANAYKIVVLDK